MAALAAVPVAAPPALAAQKCKNVGGKMKCERCQNAPSDRINELLDNLGHYQHVRLEWRGGNRRGATKNEYLARWSRQGCHYKEDITERYYTNLYNAFILKDNLDTTMEAYRQAFIANSGVGGDPWKRRNTLHDIIARARKNGRDQVTWGRGRYARNYNLAGLTEERIFRLTSGSGHGQRYPEREYRDYREAEDAYNEHMNAVAVKRGRYSFEIQPFIGINREYEQYKDICQAASPCARGNTPEVLQQKSAANKNCADARQQWMTAYQIPECFTCDANGKNHKREADRIRGEENKCNNLMRLAEKKDNPRARAMMGWGRKKRKNKKTKKKRKQKNRRTHKKRQRKTKRHNNKRKMKKTKKKRR